MKKMIQHPGISKSRSINMRSFGRTTIGRAVVMLPGGPGLSADYLDPLALELSKKKEARVIIVDYPDHESYNKDSFTGKKSFKSLCDFVTEALGSLSELGITEIILVGHSFGAKIALSRADQAIPNVDIMRIILLAPVVDGFLSQNYLEAAKKIKDADEFDFSNEKEFREYWRKLLPFYFKEIPKTTVIDELLRGTTYIQNHEFNDADLDWNKLSRQNAYVISPDTDNLVEPNQAEMIRSMVPAQNISTVNGGHFFMLENASGLLNKLIQFI